MHLIPSETKRTSEINRADFAKQFPEEAVTRLRKNRCPLPVGNNHYATRNKYYYHSSDSETNFTPLWYKEMVDYEPGDVVVLRWREAGRNDFETANQWKSSDLLERRSRLPTSAPAAKLVEI